MVAVQHDTRIGCQRTSRALFWYVPQYDGNGGDGTTIGYRDQESSGDGDSETDIPDEHEL